MDITYLAEHKEAIPTLAQWFYQEWGYLHTGWTVHDVERLIGERTNTAKIPVALVAVQGRDLLGTVCLKTHDMNTRTDLTPWLAGLYVAESWRRKGVGAALVSAIEKQAQAFQLETLYLYTPESEGFYSRLAWRVNERTEYYGYPVTIMEKKIIP